MCFLLLASTLIVEICCVVGVHSATWHNLKSPPPYLHIVVLTCQTSPWHTAPISRLSALARWLHPARAADLLLVLRFWPGFGQVPAGRPQISVEEGRVEVRMVRYWSYVVSKVNWSRCEPAWSRLDAVLGRVLAVFCHYCPLLAHFLPFSLF